MPEVEVAPRDPARPRRSSGTWMIRRLEREQAAERRDRLRRGLLLAGARRSRSPPAAISQHRREPTVRALADPRAEQRRAPPRSCRVTFPSGIAFEHDRLLLDRVRLRRDLARRVEARCPAARRERPLRRAAPSDTAGSEARNNHTGPGRTPQARCRRRPEFSGRDPQIARTTNAEGRARRYSPHHGRA